MKSWGWEFLPPAAVAVPVEGIRRIPFTVAAPFTSSVAFGAFVLIPILPVAPLPVWVTIEFWMFVAVVKSGSVFTVPPVVVTFDEAGGGAEGALPSPVVAAGAEPAVGGAARTKAEGGRPPIVSASAAFMA